MSESTKKSKKDKGPVKSNSSKSYNFDELEKEFETVLQELLADENLHQFRMHYQKLHAALVSSHESERQLISKVRTLNEEIAFNADKVATALRLSQEDEKRIVDLTTELEAAWKKVEFLKQKESASDEMIFTMREDIEGLKALVQRGADLALNYLGTATTTTTSTTSSMLLGQKEKEREVDSEELKKNKEHVANLNVNMIELTLEKEKLTDMLAMTLEDIREKTKELHREKKQVLHLREENERMKTALELMTNERNNSQKQQSLLADKLQKYQSEHLDLKVKYELCTKDMDMVNLRLQKLTAEMEKQTSMVEALQMEINEHCERVGSRDIKIAKLNETVRKVTKLKEHQSRKIKMLTDQRAMLRKDKQMLKDQLMNAEKEKEQHLKKIEADKKHIAQLMQERDISTKNYVKQVKATEKQANMVSLHERTTHSMGREIMGFHKESEKQRRLIQKLERERDRYVTDNSDLTVKLMKALEEGQLRNLMVLDLKKQREELESTIKIQKNIFEGLHQDRNMYSHQLIETQDEMKEMRSKLRVLEHQSHQLKEEVSAREAAVVKEHLECLRLEKERDSLIADIQSQKNHLREVEQVITNLHAEEKNLQKVIANSDQTIKRQTRELDTVIRERDVLGSQLVRRNDELSLLYQKIHLLQIFINNGNKMYDDRIEDIRLLRIEVKRQRHENRCLQKNVANVSSYKQELYSLHREMLRERALRAAVENELAQPRQMHRWRGLEVSDPSKFELLQKVQCLQKRLIMRTDEVVQVEKILLEKDRLYVELRLYLERQPGPDSATQITTYQRVLRKKNKQLKSLVAEYNLTETEKKLGDFDVKKLQLENDNLKKNYYKEKRRRQQLEEINRNHKKKAKDTVTSVLEQAEAGKLPSISPSGSLTVSVDSMSNKKV